MAKNRDDFTRPTVEIMAKRTGYLCSNPACRQLTVGANEIENKTTSIGIAAHITAASINGPRFDATLTPDQRSHINNGIWLCSNCAKLIDSDMEKYSVSNLQAWKLDAEEESRKKLNKEHNFHINRPPHIEVDIVFKLSSRLHKGYSDKNPIEIVDGIPSYVINYKSIIHWELEWKFGLIIFNNSTSPAFNLRIESIGNVHFSHIDSLTKINNLPPLANIDLNVQFRDSVEGDYTIADEILKPFVPTKFANLALKIVFLDENRSEHCTFVEFANGEIVNRQE